MKQAYKLAAIAVRQRLKEQYPERLKILDNFSKDRVAVYSGSYDRAEDVLNCLEIPYTLNPNPQKIADKIVFVNCSSSYDDRLIKNIEKYVSQGSWLVSSDWTLHYLIETAFPNTVRWNKKRTNDEIVSVEPNLNSLWSDIVVLGADPQWWLWGSYPIEVLNTEKVKIEAASHDLLVRYNSPVVAVNFNWGKGYVFHVISHFWAKRTNSFSPRHSQPCTDFLKAGMKLSNSGIEEVLSRAKIAPKSLNFAQIQSAATATELVAQLCINFVVNSSEKQLIQA